MKRRQFLKNTAAAGLVTVITPSGILYSRRHKDQGNIEDSFLAPPASAKPFTWWHWINGNVTRDGITRDLEAMAKVGIGGFQAFSAYMDMPHGDAEYLSPLWIDLMQHAANEALRLGLEFDLHNCMGWSSSGGSWIPPELSMQQVVWSEAFVKGGRTTSVQLKQPFKRLDYYQDSFVLAFPSMWGENDPEQNQSKNIFLDGKAIDAESISGFDLSSGIDVLSRNPSKPSYLLFEFDQSVEVASVALNASNIKKSTMDNSIIIEVSNDRRVYKKIAELDNFSKNIEIPTTIRFSRTKAKSYCCTRNDYGTVGIPF